MITKAADRKGLVVNFYNLNQLRVKHSNNKGKKLFKILKRKHKTFFHYNIKLS